MKFTELSNLSKIFYSHNTASKIYSDERNSKSNHIHSSCSQRNIKKEDKRAVDIKYIDTRIVKVASPKPSPTLKKKLNDGTRLGSSKTLSRLKNSASFKRLSKITMPLNAPEKTILETEETADMKLSKASVDKANSVHLYSSVDTSNTSLPSASATYNQIDYKMPSFEFNKGIVSKGSMCDAFTSRIHTSMYLQQMGCIESKIVQTDDSSFSAYSETAFECSDLYPKEDATFSFESPECECFERLSPDLCLNLKRDEVLGLGITTPLSKNVKSHNAFLNSYMGNNDQQISLTCDDNKREILKPINKSIIIKSNRSPLKDIKNISTVDSQLLTPLKHHKRDFLLDSMLSRSESTYLSNQKRQSKIQKKAQQDSKHHLTLAHSLNGHCTNSSKNLNNAETTSIYDGLSAAEIKDFQKVEMWANY